MKYIKLFNTTTEYNSFKEGDSYILPNISYVANDKTVMFSPARKADITFSYDVGEGNGGGTDITGIPVELTVPAGTTFGEAIEMKDEYNQLIMPIPLSCDDEWTVQSDGTIITSYAPGCLYQGDIYLLNADGSRVKTSDVIEARHYELSINNAPGGQ